MMKTINLLSQDTLVTLGMGLEGHQTRTTAFRELNRMAHHFSLATHQVQNNVKVHFFYASTTEASKHLIRATTNSINLTGSAHHGGTVAAQDDREQRLRSTNRAADKKVV